MLCGVRQQIFECIRIAVRGEQTNACPVRPPTERVLMGGLVLRSSQELLVSFRLTYLVVSLSMEVLALLMMFCVRILDP